MDTGSNKTVDELLQLLSNPSSRQSELFEIWWRGVSAYQGNIAGVAMECLKSGGSGYAEGAVMALRESGYEIKYIWYEDKLEYEIRSPSRELFLIEPENPIGATHQYPLLSDKVESISIEEAQAIADKAILQSLKRPRV